MKKLIPLILTLSLLAACFVVPALAAVNFPETAPDVLDKIEVTTKPTKITYIVGETLDLTGMIVTATYIDAPAKAVTGYTTIPAVDTILNTAGTLTVTVDYEEGGITKSDSFNVTVVAVVLEKIEVTTRPTYLNYYVGETLDLTGMVVTATYDNTSTKVVTTGCATIPAAGATLNIAGTQTVTVSYIEDGIIKTDTFNVTVVAVVLDRIEVTAQPTKTVYLVGENLSLEGLIITATYNNSSTSVIAASDYNTSLIDGAVLNTVGDQSVTVSYTKDGITKTTTFTITVKLELKSIEVTTPPTKEVYLKGELLVLDGMVVTATYHDGSASVVTDYNTNPINGAVLNTVGEQAVAVSYAEDSITETTTFTVTVKLELKSIEVTTPPKKEVYLVGELLEIGDIVVTATYHDGSTSAVTAYGTSPINGAVLNAVGTQTVTVSYAEDGITESTTFTVTVKRELKSIEVTTPPTKEVYLVGELLEIDDIVVTANYHDGSTSAVTTYVTSPINGAALNTVGEQTVTVSYTEDGITESKSFTVTVKLELKSIEVTTPPTKEVYLVGELLEIDDIVVTATYHDGSTSPVTTYVTSPTNGAALNTVGEQIVTVSYTEDGITESKSFTVTVKLELKSIEITTPPTKTEYLVGEPLELDGIVVTATYHDESISVVTAYSTTPINGATLNTVGEQTVTVSYTEDGITESKSFTVTVKLELKSIEVTTPPKKEVYLVGELLEIDDIVVTATYHDGSTSVVTAYGTSPVNGAVLNAIGTQIVTVSYTEDGITETTTFTVMVKLELKSIEVTTPPTKTEYLVGEPLELDGMVATATYHDGSTSAITTYITSLVNGEVLNTVGEQTVTVSYTEDGITELTTFTIMVKRELKSIEVTTPPTKEVYLVGQPLVLEGMVVTATYHDGSTSVVTAYGTSPVNGAVLNTIGPQIVTVSYTEDGITETTSFTVTVKLELKSIEITTPPTKVDYEVKKPLELEGMIVTATYHNESKKVVTGYTTTPASDADLDTAGLQEVTVSYTEDGVTMYASFDIKVLNPSTLNKIEVEKEPDN
ncbi:MAG: bacterial Ig-like domain-containing protein, partial [Clostridiales bacterium]|nr:bacterial Ig-like domain-containing protein [Clostridiales bacterium]